MIVKKREIPLTIQKLEALIRRMPSEHPKIHLIKESFAKRTAGYKGECSIDYPLSILPYKNYFILHDLRLFDSKHYFQIDTLVLSRKFLIILEVKNIAGSLFFDQDFHQLIRTKNGKEEAFPDPLIQISRQENQLKHWLNKNQFPDVPVYSLVVISSPYTLIQSSTKNCNLSQKIVHRDYLPTFFNVLENNCKVEKLTDKEMKKVSRHLIKQHTPKQFCILEQYELKKEYIQTGVHCPSCHFLPIQRLYGTWHCPECYRKSKDAHIFTLKDYYLLFSVSLTNREASEFLQIPNHSLTNRLLASMNLSFTGKNKGRVYFLSF